MKKRKILAIIAARGGSKSIPLKNIYPILGKPLIAYTIEAAKKSKLINRIIVSTDHEKIASISKKYGAEVPFMRPAALSGDKITDLPVFQHAISWLEKNENYRPDIVVHLYATSPLRKPTDIDKAIGQLIKNPEADSVLSVMEAAETPFKMWRADKSKYLKPIMSREYKNFYRKYKEPFSLPRQILPKILFQTGYLCVAYYKTIMKKNSMRGKKIIPFYYDRSLYTEMDSYGDLYYTEYIMKKFLKKSLK